MARSGRESKTEEQRLRAGLQGQVAKPMEGAENFVLCIFVSRSCILNQTRGWESFWELKEQCMLPILACMRTCHIWLRSISSKSLPPELHGVFEYSSPTEACFFSCSLRGSNQRGNIPPTLDKQPLSVLPMWATCFMWGSEMKSERMFRPSDKQMEEFCFFQGISREPVKEWERGRERTGGKRERGKEREETPHVSMQELPSFHFTSALVMTKNLFLVSFLLFRYWFPRSPRSLRSTIDIDEFSMHSFAVLPPAVLAD